MQKLGRLETAVGELGQRMDSTGRLADTLVAECSRKVRSLSRPSPNNKVVMKVMMVMIILMTSRLTRRNWTTSGVEWRRSAARSTTSR